jgi:hypothetical protein
LTDGRRRLWTREAQLKEEYDTDSTDGSIGMGFVPASQVRVYTVTQYS